MASSISSSSNENEYELRRRRIAEVFNQAIGPEIEALKNLPPEELEAKLEQLRNNEDNSVKSPYNLHTLFWIVATGLLFYFTEFIPTVKESPEVDRTWLYTGYIFIGSNILIGFYLVVICSWIRKIDDWEKHAPTAIPIATAFFMMGALCVNVAIWPVYGILTPLFLFTIFMGFVVTISLIPGYNLNQ